MPSLAEVREQQPASEAARCTSCASGVLVPQKVNSAFWEADRLIVVEDVPALICQSCGERYYEDKTAMLLDMMRGNGLSEDEAVRWISVPVFTFGAAGGGDAED